MTELEMVEYAKSFIDNFASIINYMECASNKQTDSLAEEKID